MSLAAPPTCKRARPGQAATAMRWLPVALFLCAACVPQSFQRRAQNVTVIPARIVSLPVLTVGEEVSFNDNYRALDDWAKAMATTLDPQIGRWVVGNRGQAFQDEGATVPAVYPKFRRWTRRVLPAIAAQMTGRANFGLSAVEQWQFDQDLTAVANRLGADFVLLTFFRDTRRTGGHVVAGVIGGLHYYFLQVGVACLLDLRVGHMVWCNAKSDAWKDLGVPANAEKAVSELLTDLYYPLPAATASPKR